MAVSPNEASTIPHKLCLYAGECYLNEKGELCYSLNDDPVPAADCLNDAVLSLGCGEARTLSAVGIYEDGSLCVLAASALEWEVETDNFRLVGRELTGLNSTEEDIPLRVALADCQELEAMVYVCVVEPVKLHIMPYNCEVSPDGMTVLEARRFPIDDVDAFPWLTGRYIGEHDWLQTIAKFSDGHWGVVLPAFVSYGSSDTDLVDIDDNGFVLCRDYTDCPVTIEAVYAINPELYASRLIEVLDIIDVALIPENSIYPAASGRLCAKNSNDELDGDEEDWLQALLIEPRQPLKVSTLFRLSDSSWHFADGTLVLVPSDGVELSRNTLTLLSEDTPEEVFLYLRDMPAVARSVALVSG